MTNEVERTWNIADISNSLQSQAELSKHPVLGTGWRFEIGPHDTSLELYPRAQHAELRTRSVVVGLSQVALDALTPEGLALRCIDGDEQTLVWLAPDGGITLHVSPPRSLDEVLGAVNDRPGPDTTAASSARLFPRPPAATPREQPSPRSLQATADPPGPTNISSPAQTSSESLTVTPKMAAESSANPVAGASSTPAQEQPNLAAQERKDRRVALMGRVGAPRFKTTRNGVLVCEFPLAVQTADADKPTWHKCVAIKERAQALQETLTKGQAVSIVGYEHISEWADQQGQKKQKVEIYTTVVRVLG